MSSTSSISSSSSSRITGLVSGIDVDSVVSQLMEAEKVPLYKLQQQKQLAEWKRDAYREITSALKSFTDKYFNYLSSGSNLLSASTLKKFSTVSTNSAVVTATGNADASAGSHTITVSNLATAAVYKSAAGVTKAISSSSAPDFTAANGKDFVMKVDGESFTITIDDSVTDVNSLQNIIDNTLGSGKVKVSSDSNGYLTIDSVDDSGVGAITLSDGSNSALSSLGFSDGSILSNRLDTSDTLEEIAAKMNNAFTFNSDDQLELSINGVSFEFDSDTTLSEMMSEINSSNAGVTMKYNSSSDTFSITAKSTGAGEKIKLSETGSTFLSGAGITDYTAGEDAVVTIDGEKFTRSSNTITLDGVTYKLLSESTEQQSVSLTLDTDSIYDQINSFVTDYNALIDILNTKITEEYDRDYQPLTDAQKEEMSDEEIASWEKKAKTGLLENDSLLENCMNSMRLMLSQSVSGVSSTLSKIGITTSSDYTQLGKLTIDSDTLKNAIEENTDEVVNLFSQSSTSYSGTLTNRTLDYSERQVRTNEEGLAWRLYDVLSDYISTSTNSSGNKGYLLEKAGMEGDGSQYDNIYYEQISKYEEEIDEMADKLDEKEDKYYEKFSIMETYINNMNTQISALQSYLSE